MSDLGIRFSRVSTHRPRLIVRAAVALTATLLICLFGHSAFAVQPDEYTLKVAYLYNFTRYITWPEDAWPAGQQGFVIGVIGDNPFGSTLDQLATKKQAQRRRIVIRYFDTLADYEPCHMLFVAASTSPEVRAAVIRQTRNQPVLVIGESAGYAEAGSPVNFVLLPNGTINIEINIDAMNRRRMQTNALLLKLASVVRDKGAE